MRRALSYPLKLIAKNAGVNGSVVTEKVWVARSSYMFHISCCVSEILNLMEMFPCNRFFLMRTSSLVTMLLPDSTRT